MARGMLDPIYWPLMDAPTVKLPCCAVCGRNWPLNDHHIVWRGWGNLLDAQGNRRPKPTVTLCGSGNTSGCHGRAHQLTLHFRYRDGRLEYLETDAPTAYVDALEMGGWEPLRNEEETWIA